MSNYIKIPTTDGTSLTIDSLTQIAIIEGGGTITVNNAEEVPDIAIIGGGGTGGKVAVSCGGRALDAASNSNWAGVGTGGAGAGATATSSTGGSGTGELGGQFDVTNTGGVLSVVMTSPGDNAKIGDTLTIAANPEGETSTWSDALTLSVVSADLATAVVGDLIAKVTSIGVGYKNSSDGVTLAAQDDGTLGITWSAALQCRIVGLVYDAGTEIFLPLDNVVSVIPQVADDAGYPQRAQIAYAQLGGVGNSLATMKLIGTIDADIQTEITLALSNAILSANSRPGSSPVVNFPTGITCSAVGYGTLPG